MTIESAFLDLMPSTVIWYKQTSRDAYGKDSWSGTVNSQRCRIEFSNSLTNTDDGQSINEDGTIYFYGVSTIELKDILELPNGKNAIVLTLNTHNDGAGQFVTVLTFGKA